MIQRLALFAMVCLVALIVPSSVPAQQYGYEMNVGESVRLNCSGGDTIVRPVDASTVSVECISGTTSQPTPTQQPTTAATSVPTATAAAPTTGPTTAPTATAMPTATTAPTVAPTVAPTATTGPSFASHPVGCDTSKGMVALDAQAWRWHNGTTANPMHLHSRVCWPYLQTITQPFDVTVTSIIHDNPGTFKRLLIQAWPHGYEGNSRLCYDETAIVCKSFTRTMATCTQTGGHLDAIAKTCTWHDTFRINPADIEDSGWTQFRIRGFVESADGIDERTSTSLNNLVENGKPRGKALYTVDNTYDHLEARAWYTNAEYAAATLVYPPTKPISGVWQPKVHLKEGSSLNGPVAPVISHMAAINTDFHNGNKGTVIKEGTGPYVGTIRIDTTKLPNGWHRLFLQARNTGWDGVDNAGAMAIWFYVQNP